MKGRRSRKQLLAIYHNDGQNMNRAFISSAVARAGDHKETSNDVKEWLTIK